GYGFKFKVPYVIDQIYLSPNIGRYQVEGRSPNEGDAEQANEDSEFKIAAASSGGLKVDFEVDAFFYIFRIWYALDMPLAKSSSGKQQVTSSRYGGDLFIKGPGTTGL